MMDWRQARWPRACAKDDWRKCTQGNHAPHQLYDEDVAVGRLRYSDGAEVRLLHHTRARNQCYVQAANQRGD